MTDEERKKRTELRQRKMLEIAKILEDVDYSGWEFIRSAINRLYEKGVSEIRRQYKFTNPEEIKEEFVYKTC